MTDKNTVDNLEAHYLALRSDIQEANRELSSLLETKEGLKDRIHNLESVRADKEKEINILDKKQEKKKQKFQDWENRLEQKEDRLIERATDLTETKQLAMKEISNERRSLERYKEEVSDDIKDLEERRDNLQESVERLELEEDQVHSSVIHLLQLQEDTKKEVNQLRDELTDIEDKHETEMEQSRNRLASLKLQIGNELNKVGKASENLKKKKKEIAKDMRDLAIWYKRIERKYKEVYPDKEFKL